MKCRIKLCFLLILCAGGCFQFLQAPGDMVFKPAIEQVVTTAVESASKYLPEQFRPSWKKSAQARFDISSHVTGGLTREARQELLRHNISTHVQAHPSGESRRIDVSNLPSVTHVQQQSIERSVNVTVENFMKSLNTQYQNYLKNPNKEAWDVFEDTRKKLQLDVVESFGQQMSKLSLNFDEQLNLVQSIAEVLFDASEQYVEKTVTQHTVSVQQVPGKKSGMWKGTFGKTLDQKQREYMQRLQANALPQDAAQALESIVREGSILAGKGVAEISKAIKQAKSIELQKSEEKARQDMLDSLQQEFEIFEQAQQKSLQDIEKLAEQKKITQQQAEQRKQDVLKQSEQWMQDAVQEKSSILNDLFEAQQQQLQIISDASKQELFAKQLREEKERLEKALQEHYQLQRSELEKSLEFGVADIQVESAQGLQKIMQMADAQAREIAIRQEAKKVRERTVQQADAQFLQLHEAASASVLQISQAEELTKILQAMEQSQADAVQRQKAREQQEQAKKEKAQKQSEKQKNRQQRRDEITQASQEIFDNLGSALLWLFAKIESDNEEKKPAQQLAVACVAMTELTLAIETKDCTKAKLQKLQTQILINVNQLTQKVDQQVHQQVEAVDNHDQEPSKKQKRYEQLIKHGGMQQIISQYQTAQKNVVQIAAQQDAKNKKQKAEQVEKIEREREQLKKDSALWDRLKIDKESVHKFGHFCKELATTMAEILAKTIEMMLGDEGLGMMAAIDTYAQTLAKQFFEQGKHQVAVKDIIAYAKKDKVYEKFHLDEASRIQYLVMCVNRDLDILWIDKNAEKSAKKASGN